MLIVVVDQFSSDDNAICYVLSGYVDDVMFAHNLWLAKVTLIGRILKVIHQGAAPGVKSSKRGLLRLLATR